MCYWSSPAFSIKLSMFSLAQASTSALMVASIWELHLVLQPTCSSFMEQKVESWVQEIVALSGIATSQPQAAYSAYVHGLRNKWSFLARVTPDLPKYMQPLEDAIRDKLIPALLGGRSINDQERELYSLPCRHGGLGLIKPKLSEFNTTTLVRSSPPSSAVFESNPCIWAMLSVWCKPTGRGFGHKPENPSVRRLSSSPVQHLRRCSGLLLWLRSAGLPVGLPADP